MDSFPDEEMCDLDTLEALLNEDDNLSSLPQAVGEKKAEDGNNRVDKTDLSDEVAEFMNAQSDDSDDEGCGVMDKIMTSSYNRSCPEVRKRSPLMNDNTEKAQSEGQKQVSSGELPVSESIQDPLSTLAIMKEMEEMKKKMEELQNRLKMQQCEEGSVSVKKEIASPEKKSQSEDSTPLSESKPTMRLMADEEEGNLFFSSKKSGSAKTLKSSPGLKRPSAVDKKKLEGDVALSKATFDDSDSDWEDLDGDSQSNLSEQGKKLKKLLKIGEKRREMHRSKFDQNFTSDLSYKKESYQGTKVDQDSIFTGSGSQKRKTAIDRHSLQCSSSSTEQSKSGMQTAKDTEKMVIEDFSRIRIVNPLISSSVMKMRMESRKLITVSRIHAKMNTADLQSDWVTIGVLVSKTNAKASSSGKPYSIWKLSDLHDLEHCVSFFLFGQVHKNHWKLDVGSVVGLLNPSMMEAMEKNKSEPAFTIKNPNQLMVMGLSKDLGWCIGHTRKGNKCPHFINKRQGEYCSYHVQAEYKKTSAQRLEFHGSVTGVRPKSFEKKIFSKNCAYIYGGNTFVPSSTSSKGKNGVTLSKLQEKVSSGRKAVNTFSIQDIKPSTEAVSKDKRLTEDKNDLFMDMISVPSPGSMNLVAHLKKGESTSSKVCSPLTSKKMESISASDLLKQHQKDMRMRRPAKTKASDLLLSSGGNQQLHNSGKGSSSSGKNPLNTPCDPLKEMPLLGKGLSCGQDISLVDSAGNRASLGAERSKLKAIMALRSKGDVLKKEDPNAVKKCKGERELQAIKKRVHKEESTSESDEAPSNSKSASSSAPQAKKSKLLGNVDLNSAEVKAILKAKSKYVGALAEKEAEREETYFEGLEKKEMLEEKMKSVTSIEINVFTCKQCHYTAQSALDQCKQEQHSIIKSKAKKRFFACKKCKHRTTTINGMFPSSPCQKCGSLCYEKTSMYKERTGPKLESEILCLRGDEVKFLNSLDHKVFMNTVVD